MFVLILSNTERVGELSTLSSELTLVPFKTVTDRSPLVVPPLVVIAFPSPSTSPISRSAEFPPVLAPMILKFCESELTSTSSFPFKTTANSTSLVPKLPTAVPVVSEFRVLVLISRLLAAITNALDALS